MSTRSTPKVSYDGRLMTEDAASMNLGPQQLADLTNGQVAKRTVYRFLSNQVQTRRTAGILASVLCQDVARYVIRSRTSAAAEQSEADLRVLEGAR